MFSVLQKSVAAGLVAVGALAAAGLWAADATTKAKNCCDEKLACCESKKDCCQAAKKSGCCDKSLACCKENKACCDKAPECCAAPAGRDCCKEAKDCCDAKSGGKSVAEAGSAAAKGQVAARQSCCSATPQTPSDVTPGNLQ